jgi:hypothetical protein
LAIDKGLSHGREQLNTTSYLVISIGSKIDTEAAENTKRAQSLMTELRVQAGFIEKYDN